MLFSQIHYQTKRGCQCIGITELSSRVMLSEVLFMRISLFFISQTVRKKGVIQPSSSLLNLFDLLFVTVGVW